MMTTLHTHRSLPALAASLTLAATLLLPAAGAHASPVGDLQSTQASPSAVAGDDAAHEQKAKEPGTKRDYAAFTTDPASVLVLVNEDHPLKPRDYRPKDLVAVSGSGAEMVPEAAQALKKLIKGARTDGHRLMVESAYRSYGHQLSLFQRYTRQYGKDYASRISARPGTSEHQLGLAADVGVASGQCSLQACLAELPAGKWIAAHAGDYGFILRYPKDQQKTTGYNFEPWHLRYIGTTAARTMDQLGIETFEQYSDELATARERRNEQKAATKAKEAEVQRQADAEQALRDAAWERQERHAERTQWWPDWARNAFVQ